MKSDQGTPSGLRWAGGKAWLCERLGEALRPLLTPGALYSEIYVGGAAQGLWLREAGIPVEQLWIDANPELVGYYREIQRDPEPVIAQAQAWTAAAIGTSTRDVYYGVRALDPAQLPSSVRAARLYWLNRHCFQGLYRVNLKGIFNVPYGRTAVVPVQPARLRALHQLLQRVTLLQGDASQVLDAVPVPASRLVTFMDPPYLGTFTAYASASWGEKQHEACAALFDRLAALGAHVVLTNKDLPWVRERFARYRVVAVQTRHNMAASAASRGKVAELVVVSTSNAEVHAMIDRWG